MTDAYKKSRDEAYKNMQLDERWEWAIFEYAGDWGYNFALNSSEVNALVEALKQISVAGYMNYAEQSVGYCMTVANEALAAFQKARDAQKAEGEK